MKPCSYAPTLYILSLVLALLLGLTLADKKSYVVYLGGHSYRTNIESIDYERVKDSHREILGSFLQSTDEAKDSIFYHYTKSINGFAATLDEQFANQLSKHPKVISVFLNQKRELQTTKSWDFLGLENNGQYSANSIWDKANFGSNAIIGNLDTGAWPESKSFSDEKMGPTPARWKGTCENEFDETFQCNSKLIGARYFNKGYIKATNGSVNLTSTPRDKEGHGTHTLSTAGGNFVPGVNVFGLGDGTAKGGSPSARVAAYKVCWPEGKIRGCLDADILAGFDAAIHDGVDVLSVSLGGSPRPFYNDSMAIGSFHAVMNGIVVVCSAGNSGPGLATATNLAPWQITVGASTIDRKFSSDVILGNNKRLKGESLSAESLQENKFFPIIYAKDAKAANANVTDAEHCKNGTLDPIKVKGKILVCLRGDNPRADKGEQASLAGAVGMVLANDISSGNTIIADAHVLPASNINYTDGLALLEYINSTRSPTASITKPTTELDVRPAPYMASFSSAGPNIFTPEILKPDITAPGVSIIAACSEAAGPSSLDFDKRRVKFNAESGTSMACPHVSGVVGLLKTLYPKWSPAAIKSAIMTTASTMDNNMKPMTTASGENATPFNYGAGQVQPNLAMDPGLVYDLSTTDYLDFLCAMGYEQNQIDPFSDKPYNCKKSMKLVDFNYPAITVLGLNGTVNVTRKVKNVGTPGTYKAHVSIPHEISVQIVPDILEFESVGEEKSFNVIIQAKSSGGMVDYVYGQLTWSDNKHNVTSQIVVIQP